MEVEGDYVTYKDVPLPDGWVWGEPDTPIDPTRTTWVKYQGDDAECYQNNYADVRVVIKT